MDKQLSKADYRVPELSVVVPVYNNAQTLIDLYKRIDKVLEKFRITYEIIFVDDSSPENSVAILQQLAKEDSRIAVLALEKNVGQHRAVLVGLSHARGDKSVILDADLQAPPEAIPLLLKELDKGYSAVFAGRRGRYQSLPRLISSRLFKWTIHGLCGVPVDAGIYVMMDKSMVKSLLAIDPRKPFVVAMIGCTNLPIRSIPVERDKRAHGKSAYSTWQRLKIGTQAIIWIIGYRLRSHHKKAEQSINKPRIRMYIGERFSSLTDKEMPLP